MEIEPAAATNALPKAVLDWIQSMGWNKNDITYFDFDALPIELKGDFGDGMKHFAPSTHCTVTLQCNGERRSQRFDMTVEGWKIDHA